MPDIGHEETEILLQSAEKRISQVYRQASEDTQKKLNDYLARFATKDKIKQEQVKKGQITQQEYAQWRKGQICIGQRWQEMVNTLTTDMVNADKLAMSIVSGYTPEVYALNHNYATFLVEKGSRIDTSYTLYDRQTVERLLREDQQLLPKARVDVPKDQRWNHQHIQQQITQGILQGESLDKVAKRLQTVADMDHSAAIRNARTITTGAENAGRVDGFERAEKMGIELEQEWLATLDGRTRHSHRQLDGERVKVGGTFSNGCRFPGDPLGPPEEVYNCRCTLVAAVKGVDQSNAPRNSKLGGMSYEEWKNEHTPKTTAPDASGVIQYSSLREKLSPVMDEETVTSIISILEKCEDQELAQLYAKSVMKIDIVNDEGNFLEDETGIVHINIENLREDSFDHVPYKTFFHEIGHRMDQMGHDERKENMYLSYVFDSGALTKAIKADGKKTLADAFAQYVSDGKASEYDKPGSSIGIKHALDYVVRAGKCGWPGKKVFRDNADVSDMLEFASGIGYPLGSGHGLKYWKQDKGLGATEFVAEYMSSKVMHPESLKLIQNAFPEASSIAEEIIKTLKETI